MTALESMSLDIRRFMTNAVGRTPVVLSVRAVVAALALSVAVAVAGGCGGPADTAVAADEKDGERKKESSRVLVRLGDFERGDISSKLAVSADLEAVREADVYPEVTGVIREVRFREGDFAERDKPVVVLFDEELRWVEQNKKILLRQARTKLELARVAAREAAAMVEVKKLSLAKAKREYDRMARLAEGGQGAISLEEVETKRFDVDEAQGSLLTGELQLEKSRLEEAQAQQNLELAQVELDTASLNLSRTRIAPLIDGYLSKLDHKPGELLSPSTLAFSIVSLDSLQAFLHVPQRELAKLRKGQDVRITSEVYAGKEFRGRVEVINPIIEKDSGTVRVTVDVEDPEGLLKPGMFINGEIILDTRVEALLVPKKAVIYDNREPLVFLAHGDKARRYVVTPGVSSKDFIEVLKLTGMDGEPADPAAGRLVLVGQNKLQDGDLVEVER